MWKKLGRYVLWVLATWGLVVLGIFSYQSSSVQPLDSEQLMKLGSATYDSQSQFVLAKAKQSYSYIQEKSFLKSLIGLPSAAIKYSWESEYTYGIELPLSGAWKASYENEVITVKVPSLILLEVKTHLKKDPEVIHSSIFYSISAMEKEMETKKMSIALKEGKELVKEVDTEAKKALAKILLTFFQSLNLNETVSTVKVEFEE